MGAFATGELSEAQNTLVEEELIVEEKGANFSPLIKNKFSDNVFI